MGQVLNKNEIVKEPTYNCGDKNIGSPILPCPSKKKESNDKLEKKITALYFTDLTGKKITTINNETEINLVLESENLSGEDVIIEFPNFKENLNHEEKDIKSENIIKVKVQGNLTKVKLKI